MNEMLMSLPRIVRGGLPLGHSEFESTICHIPVASYGLALIESLNAKNASLRLDRAGLLTQIEVCSLSSFAREEAQSCQQQAESIASSSQERPSASDLPLCKKLNNKLAPVPLFLEECHVDGPD